MENFFISLESNPLHISHNPRSYLELYISTYIHLVLETTPLIRCIEKKGEREKETKNRFSIPRVFQPPTNDGSKDGGSIGSRWIFIKFGWQMAVKRWQWQTSIANELVVSWFWQIPVWTAGQGRHKGARWGCAGTMEPTSPLWTFSIYMCVCVCVRVFIYKVDRWRGVEFITNFCVFSNRE